MSSSEHNDPAVMGDSSVDVMATAIHSEGEPGRMSPASAASYESCLESAGEEVETPHADVLDPAVNDEAAESTESRVHPGDESDSTPRSEVPSGVDGWDHNANPDQTGHSETGYFAPQPLRYFSNKLPPTTSSTEPSPMPSLNASTTSVDCVNVETTTNAAAALEHHDRPSVLRDVSTSSTASTSTVRPPSTEPSRRFTTPPKPHKDGPSYPNQAYAALQTQHYPPPYSPQILRTRSSHAAHISPFSKIATFSLGNEERSMLDTGSRTVGNSPASSPGLFSPATPSSSYPHDDHGSYPSPYLHYTHRQAPKETHVADVDVDPVSGRKIINAYEVIDELGRGVHGKVKLGRNLETGVFVAIKIVDRYSKRRRLGKNTNHEDKIKKEIAILKKARHPNIVSLLEVIDDPSRKKVYIVLEHVELGEIKWRTDAAKEIAQVEFRKFQREKHGIFDNDAAVHEDDTIINTAHRRLERRERQRLKELHERRMLQEPQLQSWSFEHGGDSDEETSDNESRSRSTENRAVELSGGYNGGDECRTEQHQQGNTLTTSRSQTPIAGSHHITQHGDLTGLEGTMYGAYEPEIFRGRTPSVAGSLSSHYTDPDDMSDIDEHFRYVPLMTLEGTREAFRDTVLGLEYLHYQGVIHRDIKPANLLLTKEHRVKISDFGVSFLGKQSPDESDDMSESEAHDADEAIELAKTVGTPAFYAPELCRTDVDAETPPVTGKIDVWALGVTLYCLVFGRVPFHEQNTFALMRAITEEDVYIPRYRLKAVAEKSSSRPSSHGPSYHSISSNKRAPHDLEYEEVNDDLHDLIKRLLIKDPRKRITLKEIKHHPWLLQGIDNKVAWVEETDPKRQTKGRKIEVSKDEVAQAVMPIKFMDRVQSVFKKTIGAMTGLGTRAGSRRRAQSSATNPEATGQLSTASSSSTISQDGRRPSLAMNESIYAALRSSREPDHPLSHSVTVSPEAKEHAPYFDGSRSRPESPISYSENLENPSPLASSSRPHHLERAQSTMSTTASVRTIRQSDMLNTSGAASPPLLPALPGTPLALDGLGGSNLGGIFGGLPRRVITSVRSRDRNSGHRQSHSRAKSIDRLVDADDDAHGGPTLALSNTLAAGHVDPPAVLKDHSPIHAATRLFPDPIERTSSRQSSISSTSSRLNSVYTIEERTSAQSPGSYPFPSLQRNTSDDRFNRAKEELTRRRIFEDSQHRERPSSGTYSRPVSALSQIACPPSPDDEVFFERQRLDDMFNRQHPSQGSSMETSPVGYSGSVNTVQSAALTSSSSEDHFTSMSQSTSNPSIPSVISATSSVALDDGFTLDLAKKQGVKTGLDPNVAIADDYAGYDGDHAVEIGDEEDDSDEDDFIVMNKKSGVRRSDSIANDPIAAAAMAP
ncbi:kinase-like protein [Mytilinidion resinicola]|uniref:non-specific serine/threonine protein kinase n=1 Tax=Mytilinidion resinicola TaxID=574789 RepID=A0A6A6YP53_9PEZI|nr:kinase-like protein [Mytilinidion resinicola]KAF2809647.1 kinase-like protein [Mytilinidion resinicola]